MTPTEARASLRDRAKYPLFAMRLKDAAAALAIPSGRKWAEIPDDEIVKLWEWFQPVPQLSAEEVDARAEWLLPETVAP